MAIPSVGIFGCVGPEELMVGVGLIGVIVFLEAIVVGITCVDVAEGTCFFCDLVEGIVSVVVLFVWKGAFSGVAEEIAVWVKGVEIFDVERVVLLDGAREEINLVGGRAESVGIGFCKEVVAFVVGIIGVRVEGLSSRRVTGDFGEVVGVVGVVDGRVVG